MRRTHTLVLVLVILFGLNVFRHPRSAARAIATGAPLPTALPPSMVGKDGLDDIPTSTPGPLPAGCIDGLPEVDAQACCLYGYVIINGEAVEHAEVTIHTSNNTHVEWTFRRIGVDHPYYHIDLTKVITGTETQVVTLTAAYSGRTTTITHALSLGKQQVDVVLPRQSDENAPDYVFAGQSRRLAPAGKLEVPADLAIDTLGMVYVLDTENNRVQVFDNKGNFRRQWGTYGAYPGAMNNPRGIAIGPDANVYIADMDNDRVQVFSTDGSYKSHWGGFGSAPGQFDRPIDLAVNSSGDIYVVDAGNYRIQVFDKYGTFKHMWGSQGNGNEQFNEPHGIAIDADSNVYVTDTANARILKFDRAGAYLTQWGTRGNGLGQFNNPNRIAVNKNYVYVTDWDNRTVQRFKPSGEEARLFGLQGTDDDQFLQPAGVAINPQGLVYITDLELNRVQIFGPEGHYIQKWDSADRERAGVLKAAEGIAVDAEGTIYVADTGNRRIQVFDREGRYKAHWSTTQLMTPTLITVGLNGQIYVGDTQSGRIEVFDPSGNHIHGWTLPQLPLSRMEGLAAAQDGRLYVSDSLQNRILVFNAQGSLVARWDGGGSINKPQGITVAPNGKIYVVNSGNQQVKVFTRDGVLQDDWPIGSSTSPFPSSYRQSIAVDRLGFVYVTINSVFALPVTHTLQILRPDGTPAGRLGTTASGPGQIKQPSGIAIDKENRMLVTDRARFAVQVFKPITVTWPHATIVSVRPRTVEQGQPISLTGRGSAGEETAHINGYEWRINDELAPFATTASATLSTTDLPPGNYTIHFRARDDQDIVSDPQTIDIQVDYPADYVKKTWTFLLYLDADVNASVEGMGDSLVSDLATALQHLYRAETYHNVNVAILHDRPGKGNSVYLLRRAQESAFQQVRINLVNEVDMGDPQTLIDFVQWSRQAAPTDHYYLAVADHGNNLFGTAWDYTTRNDGHARLSNGDLRQALLQLRRGDRPLIDVLHLDACLLGHIENAYQLAGGAQYLVASENLAWGLFAYAQYARKIDLTGTPTPRYLASLVAQHYAGGMQNKRAFTIAALDLSHVEQAARDMQSLSQQLKELALRGEDHRALLEEVRAQVQTLDSDGDFQTGDDDDELIDLIDWLELLSAKLSHVPAIRTSTAKLTETLDLLIIKEHHASGAFTINGKVLTSMLEKTHGLGIYYPQQPNVHMQFYLGQAIKTDGVGSSAELLFPLDTGWGAFLTAALDPEEFNNELSTNPQPIPPLRAHYYHQYVPIIMS